jgi:glutamine amidotransferase
MARLFGLIGNRADLAGRVLAHEAKALRVNAQALGGPTGWGLGFYQGGEVLMRRRPLDEREEIDVSKNAGDVRTDVALGHVRNATVGSLRTENTHPFRYRQWLFAQTGTVDKFDLVRERLLANVPDFLRGDIRGETDAELVFHVTLSFLHDAGKLEDGAVEASAIRDALRSTKAMIDAMMAEVGGSPCALNVLITNGEQMVALHCGAPMAYTELSGKGDADVLIGDDVQLRRRAPELSRMHFVLLASDFEEPPGGRFKTLPDSCLVTLLRDSAPTYEPI